ncbi:MAG: hypothetical protein KC478_09865 [Bacteriovoracaceae bacterium]|nr:hypothetical protein [Bacteriovoracaceae bacterium]
MKLQRFVVFTLLTLLALPSAFARKPAVEDFVGVETESYARTPQGTEFVFEFGNTVQAMGTNTNFWSEWVPTIVLFSFIMLPFAMWFGITRSANNVAKTAAETPVNNVASLSDYKKEDKDDQDSFKKAS